MKNLVRIHLIIVLVISNLYVNAQAEKTMIESEYIIGDYGISLKNKKIGRLEYFDCSDENYHAECYGYFEIPNLNFETTYLYIIGKEVLFIEDQAFDTNTLQTLELGMSWKEATKKDALYFDKNGLYRRLFAKNKIIDLKEYTHLESHFFTKDNELYFADIYGFYKINKTQKLDFKSIKLIAGNYFMDKNGFYFSNTYSIDNGGKIDRIEYIKIQDSVANPEISITDDYCIINKKVYPLHSQLQEINLDYRKIQKLVIDEYDGKIVLSDGLNVYYRYQSNYTFEKIDCNSENKKNELYCLEKDFLKIRLLRDTAYNEYHFDIDNGILYFDKKDSKMEFENPSGTIFELNDGFYLYDDYSTATRINEVKIWNTQKEVYENIEREKYQFISREKYYYKGNLYGNHSRLEQNDFNINGLKIIKAYGHSYIADDKILIDFNESGKLNIAKLKVIKMPDGEPTNYLTDGKNLIYENQLIENFENIDIKVVSQDLLVTKNNIYSKGEVISREKFKIPIKFLNNRE